MIRVQVANEPVRTRSRSAVVVPGSTSQLINDSHFVSDAAYVHTDNNYTAAEKTKLEGIIPEAKADKSALQTLLIGILRAGVYTSDQESAIDALAEALTPPVTFTKSGTTLIGIGTRSIETIAKSGTHLICA